MKGSLFKYVSKVEYADLLTSGNVFHQTLARFRDYEDSSIKQIIGDEYEATRLYRPHNGLQVNNLTNGTSGLLDMGLESFCRANEIYAFCLSLHMTDKLKEEFQARACVEINEPRIFNQRWQRALPQNARFFSRRIKYYDRDEVPGNIWPQPKRIATSKLSIFSYQKEYRFGFTTTSALDFGECSQHLDDRKKRPTPKPEQHHNITLNLGDLSDICTLHMFNVSEADSSASLRNDNT